jgi:hypothetical protein
MLPELHQRKDAEQGYPLAKLVEGERPSLEKLRHKIQKFGELRDPSAARSQYDEKTLLTLGKRVVAKGRVHQRGTNGSITAFGEFIDPSARFGPSHSGKVLEIRRSVNPAHNLTVTIAQVDPAVPTRAVISPPLSVDAGPLTWELQDAVIEPRDRTVVETTFGDASNISPGWTLFDGSSEFEVLARTQLGTRTEKEGTEGILTGASRALTGVVTVTAGETTVTGAGTAFLTEVTPGGYLRISTQPDTSYTKVAKVLSDTSLVLSGGYRGSSEAWSAHYEFHQFVLASDSFTLGDIGKRLTVAGSAVESNNDKYEIENVLRLGPADVSYSGATVALTGTISVSNGLTAVTGVGTLFLSEVAPGGYIKLASQGNTAYARIRTVTTDTALTLETGYGGASGSSAGQYTVELEYRLAVIRRVGPSDHMVAGTPIKEDSGPLTWALLPRPQLVLRGRVQGLRGVLEQHGYDAEITAVGPRQGTPTLPLALPKPASITAVAGGQATVTGLYDMSLDDVGRFITISGAATASNNGTFRISALISASSVKYTNALAVAPDANNGAISWITLTEDQVELRMPSGKFSPDLSGSLASITTAVTVDAVRTMTIVGLAGMEPSCVGHRLQISGATTPNNSATPFTITKYINATSVEYTNNNGVASDANNGAIRWVYESPDRGKLLTLRGPGTNNGTVEIVGVSSTTTSITAAQRVVPQIANPALADIPEPFAVDAGPLAWELRPATGLAGDVESPAYQQVQVRAPSLLQYLARDYGVDIDIRESEDRQRSWVKNNSRWIGIKGIGEAYSILGAISGFGITPEALYRISQDFSLAIPREYVHETGEYALGRSSPNPENPSTRDGRLSLGSGGRVEFYSPTALFRPADVGLQVRIQWAAVAENNKLYTVDQYVSPTTVRFRVVDSATLPEANNDSLQWNLTRLYTTKPPLRARFDDLDPELLGQLINPTATAYLSGAAADGDILYASVIRGVLGNDIRVAHVEVPGPLALPVITVSGLDITISYEAGATAAAVELALAATPAANVLIAAIPQNGASGPISAHAFTSLAGGEDHFALDRFCWEDTFDSSVDGLLPFRADSPDPDGRVQYTAGPDGGYGVRITHRDVTGSPVLVTVAGNHVTVQYDAIIATANEVRAAFLSNPAALALVVATPQGTGTGIFAPVTETNAILNITNVTQVAENLWGITVSGALNAVLDTQGGNWRITDDNGVDFFLESAPVASGSDWTVTAFSAVAPIEGPIVLTYDCTPIFSCDYCAASKVLLTIEPTTILNDAQDLLALELILNRMISRVAQVTPAHVQAIPLFVSTLSAGFNLQARVETGATSVLPLVAPFQAYYDMVEGDVFPIDSHIILSAVEGPYYSFSTGAIGPVVGPTATLSGFTDLTTDVTGQNIVITGAATPANNGTFPITGYSATTIEYTNGAAVAGDANNGSILATTTP